MKRILQLALAIALVSVSYGPVKRVVAPQCENPKAWYLGYNETYFDNALPLDTVVDYTNHEEGTLASTSFENGHFHIAFNPAYASSAPVVHLYLYHEICHVASWTEDKEHGAAWKSCMRRLESKGAIDDTLVKVYE